MDENNEQRIIELLEELVNQGEEVEKASKLYQTRWKIKVIVSVISIALLLCIGGIILWNVGNIMPSARINQNAVRMTPYVMPTIGATNTPWMVIINPGTE